MDNQQRALLHFMQLRSKNPDYDFRFLEHDGRKYVALYVDSAKMDKNSPSYDENYRNGIAPKIDRPRQGFFFPTPRTKKFENLIDDAKKFIGIKENYWFCFQQKNYEYLEEVGEKIKKIIQNEYEGSTCEFGADSDDPLIEMLVANVGYGENDEFKTKTDEIESHLNKEGLTLKSYTVRIRIN
jgi:hypothetical protein